MPVLTLERDLKGNHPVVNKLSSNYFSTRRSSWCFSKPSSTHLGVNILANLLNIVRREFLVNFLWNFRSHCHHFYVVKSLFRRLLVFTQEGLLVLFLPF